MIILDMDIRTSSQQSGSRVANMMGCLHCKMKRGTAAAAVPPVNAQPERYGCANIEGSEGGRLRRSDKIVDCLARFGAHRDKC